MDFRRWGIAEVGFVGGKEVEIVRGVSNSIRFWVDCGNGVVSSMFSTYYTIKAQSTSQRLSLHLLEGKTREDSE